MTRGAAFSLNGTTTSKRGRPSVPKPGFEGVIADALASTLFRRALGSNVDERIVFLGKGLDKRL